MPPCGFDTRSGTVAPDRENRVAGRHVGNRDVGPEFVHRQPLHQLGGLGAVDVEQIAVGDPDDEKIEQDFALWRKQRRMKRRVGRRTRSNLLQIVGDEPLQQLFAVAACHAHDATVGKSRYVGGGHRVSLRLQTG